MKIRNYEKENIIYILIVLLFIIESIFIFNLFHKKEFIYKKMTGIVMKDNIMLLVSSKEQNKLLNKNKYLYINNKKKKYKIIEVKRNIITKGKTKYNETLIEIKFDKKYKPNDMIDVVLKDKKIYIFELFRNVIRGD